MKLRLLSASLLFACTLSHAAENPVPKPVAEQVARLVELLKDGFASGYPEATQPSVIHLALIGEESKRFVEKD